MCRLLLHLYRQSRAFASTLVRLLSTTLRVRTIRRQRSTEIGNQERHEAEAAP